MLVLLLSQPPKDEFGCGTATLGTLLLLSHPPKSSSPATCTGCLIADAVAERLLPLKPVMLSPDSHVLVAMVAAAFGCTEGGAVVKPGERHASLFELHGFMALAGNALLTAAGETIGFDCTPVSFDDKLKADDVESSTAYGVRAFPSACSGIVVASLWESVDGTAHAWETGASYARSARPLGVLKGLCVELGRGTLCTFDGWGTAGLGAKKLPPALVD